MRDIIIVLIALYLIGRLFTHETTVSPEEVKAIAASCTAQGLVPDIKITNSVISMQCVQPTK